MYSKGTSEEIVERALKDYANRDARHQDKQELRELLRDPQKQVRDEKV